MPNKMKTIVVEYVESVYLKSLATYIKELQDTLNNIPEEYQDSALISIVAEGEEDAYIAGEISYKRQETDDERDVREAKEESARKRLEEYELKEFERLHKKYSPKSPL